MQSNHTVRTAFGPQPRVQLHPTGETKTKQSFKDETDINTIMARFQTTGMLEFINKHEPQYGDVSNIDFQTSMENVATTREMFADLPSKVRDRFDNDPAQLLEFLENPENREEAVLLGLAKAPPKPPKTPEAPVVPDKTVKAAEQRKRGSDEPKAKSTDTKVTEKGT